VIYVDANVFVYVLIYNKRLDEFKKSSNYLSQIINGNLVACSSTLTWDEVFYVAFRESKDIKTAAMVGKQLLMFSNLLFVGADFGIINQAQKIAEKYSMMPRDAIHAASALEYCAGEVISNDSDFDVVPEIKRRF